MFQAIRSGLFEFESQPVTGGPQFAKPRLLAFRVAPLCYGHIDHPQAGFPQEALRKTSDDTFIVGMRRKNQRHRGVGGRGWLPGCRHSSEWKGLAFVQQTGESRNKFVVRIHSCRLGPGNDRALRETRRMGCGSSDPFCSPGFGVRPRPECSCATSNRQPPFRGIVSQARQR